MRNYIQTPLHRNPERRFLQTPEPYLWLGIRGDDAGTFGARLSRGIYSTELDDYIAPLRMGNAAVSVSRICTPQVLFPHSSVPVSVRMPQQLPNGPHPIALEALYGYSASLDMPAWSLTQTEQEAAIWEVRVPNKKLDMHVVEYDQHHNRSVHAAHLIAAGLRLVIAASIGAAQHRG